MLMQLKQKEKKLPEIKKINYNQCSYPFLNKKFKDFSRTFKDTFRIFQGPHSVHKKSLESMSFFSSSTSGEFYPEGLCVCSFAFAVLLKLLS